MKESVIYFEPMEPILSKEDFVRELLLFKEKENNDLTIVKEGMAPTVKLQGQTYRCMLEQPRGIQSHNPIITALSFFPRTFGYKFVYFNLIDEE